MKIWSHPFCTGKVIDATFYTSCHGIFEISNLVRKAEPCENSNWVSVPWLGSKNVNRKMKISPPSGTRLTWKLLQMKATVRPDLVRISFGIKKIIFNLKNHVLQQWSCFRHVNPCKSETSDRCDASIRKQFFWEAFLSAWSQLFWEHYR